MNATTKQKIAYYGWPITYFVLGVALAISVAAAAYKTSFVRIYVSGQSMEPTLNGGSAGGAVVGDKVDFGYMDPSAQAINNLKRFNIVTTYFPYSWQSADYDKAGNLVSSAAYKIKRVIGFPGETVELKALTNGTCTIKITAGQTTNEYTYSNTNKNWVDSNQHTYAFEIKHDRMDIEDFLCRNIKTTLKDDEYFVMGDNWNVSSDSASNHYQTGVHLKKNNLQGVLVAIEGTATVYNNQTTGKKDLKDLVYGDKKYYYTEL